MPQKCPVCLKGLLGNLPGELIDPAKRDKMGTMGTLSVARTNGR